MLLFKLCNKCEKDKSSNEFRTVRHHKDGLSYYCKQCEREDTKQRYNANPTQKVAQVMEWERKHATDPVYKIKKRHSIKGKYEYIKTHLESKFEAGMAWENYGVVWIIKHRYSIKTCQQNKTDYKSIDNLMLVLKNVPRRTLLS